MTSGSGPPPCPRATRSATSPIETGRPEQTLYAANPPVGSVGDRPQRQHVGPGHVGDVHEVAHLRAVLEDPRRLAALERRAEHRGDAGVRRVLRHPRPVDVVVAQRDRRRAGLPRPRGGVVLLRDLAGGVAAARVEPGVLVDQLPVQRATAVGTGAVELPGLQGRRPRVAPAAGGRAPGRRSGPRRRRPSTRPAPAGRRRPRSSWPAARRWPGRCARRTPAGRPPGPPRRPARSGGRPRRRRRAGAPRWRRRGRRAGACRRVSVRRRAPAAGVRRRARPRRRRPASWRSISDPMKPADPVSRTLMRARR